MKKKILFLIILMMIFPMMVSAKTYTAKELVDESNFIVLEEGDIIDFTGGANTYASWTRVDIFLDGEDISADQCYSAIPDYANSHTNNELACTNIFVVPTRMIPSFIDYMYRPTSQYGNIFYQTAVFHFKSYHDEQVYHYTKMNNRQILMPQSFLHFDISSTDEFVTMHIYDYNGNITVSHINNYNIRIINYYVDSLDNGMSWQFTYFDDGCYNEYSVQLTPVSYIEPEFLLKCDDDRIEYGKKTKCSVSVVSHYPMEYVSFDLSNPNFKISNEKGTANIESFDGDKEYNYSFPDNYDYEQEYTFMTFDVEATKPENYTDNIKILNLYYSDVITEDDYGDLDGSISVIYKMINPDTFNNLFFIIIPLFLSGVSFLYYQNFKKRENNN